MTAVFAGVLLFSFVIERMFSPAGDAALQALDRKQVNVTGVIASVRSGRPLTLADGHTSYILDDQDRARTWAGRRVHVSGLLHESTGVLEIRRIDPISR